MNYHDVTTEDVNEYVKRLIEELIVKKPSLVSIKDSNINIDDEIISIEVNTKNEQDLIIKEIKWFSKKLSEFGLGDFSITTVFNKENNETIVKELEKEQKSIDDQTKEQIEGNEKIIIGGHIEGEVTPISNLKKLIY